MASARSAASGSSRTATALNHSMARAAKLCFSSSRSTHSTRNCNMPNANMPNLAHPPITSQDNWLAKRIVLQTHEKELTKHRDRVNAERRQLPMVKIEKEYVFDTSTGKRSLKD